MELWFRQYHGETCDPRWLGIASAAGAGVTPGHVLAVWCALKECASKSKPRGRVDAFDARTVAEFFMWPRHQVDAIVSAIAERGMVLDGVIVEWADRQPVKKDATAAKRMRDYRKRSKGTGDDSAKGEDVTKRYGVTGVTGDGVTPVTVTEEKEQSKSSFSDASRQEPSITLKSEPSSNVRVRTGAIIDRGSFWQWLAAHGMPAHIGIRTMQAGRLSQWIEQGLTDGDLAEALSRAKRKRERERSLAPVNLGFLACFVDEVLSGQPMTTTGGGYERGDELSREFVNS